MSRPLHKNTGKNMPEVIKKTAWKQIAKSGAAALSLRSIARDLKITAPAIYNYFHRRDDLINALAVDALTSLSQAQHQSIQAIPESQLERRLSTLGIAYRDWAIQNVDHYQLIFGAAIPDYEAPADITMPAMAWALIPLLQTLQALFMAGKLRLAGLSPLTPALRSMLEKGQIYARDRGDNFDIEVLYLAYVIWSRVHGLVSLELGHKMPSFITDSGEIFRREISNIAIQYL